ncbi:MAG: hypothetical protein RBU45_21170 [Myxococcota bacterium]|jgi:hypothetical protein|nr:hypothetical protein [Myxococcota bacterium]
MDQGGREADAPSSHPARRRGSRTATGGRCPRGPVRPAAAGLLLLLLAAGAPTAAASPGEPSGEATLDEAWPDEAWPDEAWPDEAEVWQELQPEVEYRRPPLPAFGVLLQETFQGHLAYRGFFFPATTDRAGRTHDRYRQEVQLRLEEQRALASWLSLYLELDGRFCDSNYSPALLFDGAVRERPGTASQGLTAAPAGVRQPAVAAPPSLAAGRLPLTGELIQEPRGVQELRPLLNVNDLYLLASASLLDLRLGVQTFAWGTGDLRNPTDNLNPQDLLDPFEARKIGVLAARLNLYLGDFNLEGVFVPFLVPSRRPPDAGRYAPAGPPLGAAPVALQLTSVEELPAFPAESQQAVRLSRSLGGWDFSASFYSGFNKLPVLHLVGTEGLVPGTATPLVTFTATTSYEPVFVYGLDFATTLGWLASGTGSLGDVLRKVQLHGEAGLTDSRARTGDDYVTWLVGVNYTFTDLIRDHDLLLVLEVVDEVLIARRSRDGTEQATVALSPALRAGLEPSLPALADWIAQATSLQRKLGGAVLGRLTYELSETFALESAWAFPLRGATQGYLRPALTWDITDDVQLIGAYDWFFGEEGTFFGDYSEDDRIYGQLRVTF